MVTVSYAITAWNEHEELDRLLSLLHKCKRDVDEIILQLDTTATKEVREVAEKYQGVTTIEFPLKKDFATYKNNLVKSCKCSIIVFIDADEYVSEEFLEYLPGILESNEDVDVISIPRWNTVDGLTQEHIVKWRWRVDELGRVNFPDLQTRIMKNNGNMKWEGKVHERITGWKTISRLPDEFCLYHPKTIDRQEKQNALYESI
jgi:hypothetical protein